MKFYFTALLFSIAAYGCSQSSQGNRKADVKTKSVSTALGDLIPDTNWTTKVEKTDAEWKKILTPAQYHITREQGTEPPFSSKLNGNKETGIYYCVSCKNPLFSSKTKFESGTGWPSFYAPYAAKSLHVALDNSAGMTRDQISCQRCGAHLGHVFDDGPKPTGLRYCMDGLALQFQKEDLNANWQTAVFASGCFWCVEAIFESMKGVREAVSGYSGGTEKNPTYEQVGGGASSHAEAVEVYYDSSKITYPELLKVFFASQDPTQVNGQGPDRGRQYRSIAFYKNDVEKNQVEEYISMLNKSGKYKKTIATEVTAFDKFWKAEDYHQDYVAQNPNVPYVVHESIPRLARAQQALPEFIKPDKKLKQ